MALASDTAQETNLGRDLQGRLHNPQKSATTYRGQGEKESEPRARVGRQGRKSWFCGINSRQTWDGEFRGSLLRYCPKKKKKKVDRWEGGREEGGMEGGEEKTGEKGEAL